MHSNYLYYIACNYIIDSADIFGVLSSKEMGINKYRRINLMCKQSNYATALMMLKFACISKQKYTEKENKEMKLKVILIFKSLLLYLQ